MREGRIMWYSHRGRNWLRRVSRNEEFFSSLAFRAAIPAVGRRRRAVEVRQRRFRGSEVQLLRGKSAGGGSVAAGMPNGKLSSRRCR